MNLMNEDQIIALVRETFDEVSPEYDNKALRFFSETAMHLTAYLDLCGNEQVIDVATGTGNAALTIASALLGGRVTGVDFSTGMLNQARNKASSMHLENVEFIEQDMRTIGFSPNRFDVAVCSFGIFFVNDMDSQLLRIARVVKSGGRVAITSFAETQFHPLRDMMCDRLSTYGISQFPQAWKLVASDMGCRNLFERANLKDIRIESKNVGYYLDAAEDWWDIVWNAGFRRLVNQLSTDNLKRFKQEHLEEVDSLRTEHGIWLNAPVLLTIGTKR